jgi:nitroreductase
MTSTIVEEARTGAGLTDLIYRRHSVRSYKTDAVVEERRIRALLDAAVHAPTAMHQEPWRFIIVQDRAVLGRISERAKQITRLEALHEGNVLKRPGSSGDGIASRVGDPEFNIFYDAGTLVIIAAATTNEFVTADCWLAAENLMLAACAQGLGTCCIGSAVAALNLPETKSEIGIPAEMQAIVPIIVGVPREATYPAPRKLAVILNWVRPRDNAANAHSSA